MNTCSIKFLPKAHIGNSIRMTKDKSTIEFDNKPMVGLKIIEYSKFGFEIQHESLPKTFWVDFDQLPLTRLTIKNGVIEDEITFVENFVNHKMQLIRTLDTEYIDLIYATKELEKEKDKTISILNASPGGVYKGARCKEGTEMIFLGNLYTKNIERSNDGWRHDNRSHTFSIATVSPRKAFFAIPSDELSGEESSQLETKFNAGWDNKPSLNYTMKDPDYKIKHEHAMAMWRERGIKCEEAKKELIKNSTKRYRIIEYPVTSKVIKELIEVGKIYSDFEDLEDNMSLINHMSYKVGKAYMDKYNIDYYFLCKPPEERSFGFLITSSPSHTKVYSSKVNIDKLFEEFVTKYGNQRVVKTV